MITIGIDTGLHGAIAILEDNKEPIIHDIPSFMVTKTTGKKRGEYDIPALVRLLKPYKDKHVRVCLESLSAFPGQSATALWSQARGVGIIEGIIHSFSLPLHRVRPAAWKKALSLTKDKKLCVTKARELFPTCDLPFSKDGRAESLLIAYFLLHLSHV